LKSKGLTPISIYFKPANQSKSVSSNSTIVVSKAPVPISAKKSQAISRSPNNSDAENEGPDTEEEKEEKDDVMDSDNEAQTLDKRRSRYKCGDDYVTLNQIETWESTLLRTNAASNVIKTNYKHNSSHNQKISLWRGDITTLEIDAIVNAAKPSLLGGGGIDGAIHKAAGKGLLQECMGLDGCDVGDAKITSGHLLPASFVIHTVGPIGEDSNSLISCYRSALDLVAKHSVRSVAFCCVSTGIYGYPNDKAALVALKTTREWLDQNDTSDIERIIFCMFMDKDHKIYSKVMQHYFPPPSVST